MDRRSIEAWLELVADVGMASLGAAFGLLLVSAALIEAWTRRRDWRHLARYSVPLGVLAALGAALIAGMWWWMWTDHGWPGVLGLVGVQLLPLAALLVPDRDTGPTSPEPPSEAAPIDSAPPGLGRRVAAGTPALLMGFAYGAALAGHPVLWFSERSLGRMMQVEFLVIHSFGFLGLLAAPHLPSWRAQILRGYAFFAVFGIYLKIAVDDGLDTAADLLVAAFATYGGLLAPVRSASPTTRLARRWGVAFAVFVALAFAFAMPQNVGSWKSADHVLAFGLTYFAVLAAAELSGLYDRRFWRWAPNPAGSSSASS